MVNKGKSVKMNVDKIRSYFFQELEHVSKVCP